MSDEEKVVSKLQAFNQKSEELNETIKQLLIYVGLVVAMISAVVYIIITIVMVKGFKTDLELSQQVTFAVLGLISGTSITMSLILQGVAFAKRVPKAQQVMEEYYEATNKEKKVEELHTIDHFIKWALIKTIFIRGITTALSLFFVLFIFINGNGNWSLVGLAFANVLMFTGFGLLGLPNAYDFYLKQHIPAISEMTKRILKARKPKAPKKGTKKKPIKKKGDIK